MNEQEFIASIKSDSPSEPDFKGNVMLLALWFVLRGDWQKAHLIVQGDESKISSWIHALVHKVEGDLGNSRYWYIKARVKLSKDISLEEEGREILKAILS